MAPPRRPCRHRDIRPERLQIATRAQKRRRARARWTASLARSLGFPFELFSVALPTTMMMMMMRLQAGSVRRPTAFHVKIELSRPALNRHSDPIRPSFSRSKGKDCQEFAEGVGKAREGVAARPEGSPSCRQSLAASGMPCIPRRLKINLRVLEMGRIVLAAQKKLAKNLGFPFLRRAEGRE